MSCENLLHTDYPDTYRGLPTRKHLYSLSLQQFRAPGHHKGLGDTMDRIPAQLKYFSLERSIGVLQVKRGNLPTNKVTQVIKQECKEGVRVKRFP